TGRIEELSLSFSASRQAVTGPTKSLMGAYSAQTLLSAAGVTHLVANSDGEVMAFSIHPNAISAGSGVISPGGQFRIQTSDSTFIEGAVNPTSKSWRGSTRWADRPAAEFLGRGNATPSTDRLINLSSRV